MMKKLKEQVFISVVLYVHNKESVVTDSLDKIWNLLDDKFEKFEIIILDDASIDNSTNKIKDYCTKKDVKKTTLINLTRKHGLETAIQVGVDFSIGDFVIELDSAEITYDINTIYKLYDKSCEGYDIVSLQLDKNNRFSSILFYWILNKFFETNINLGPQVAHLLTRRAVNAISQIKDKTKYRKILHVFIGYKKAILNLELKKKIISSYSFAEKVKMSSDILFSFTNIGIKINIYIALIFFLFSLSLGAYSIYQYLTYKKIVEGWATIMVFLSFSFSGLFFILAIINKYFALMLGEIRTLPSYSIKSIEKI